jgi:N-acyl-D-glutamate deacylase
MPSPKFDLVIQNGHIVDPESGWDGPGNIGVTDGKIAAISKDSLEGARVIDATGQYVSPGFIDLHSHSIMQICGNWMQAFDGVTTALELELGDLPVSETYDKYAKQGGRPLNYGLSASASMARIAVLEDEQPSSDVYWYLKSFTQTEWQQNLATDAQLEKIIELVEQGLKEGAIGIGCNYGYAPAVGRKEYYKMAELAKKYDVPTYTHVRYVSTEEPLSSFEAIEELIGLSFNPGAHMHICHLNSCSLRDIDDIRDLIISARKNGANITVESYPYGAICAPVGSAYLMQDNWKARMGNIQSSDIEFLGKPLNDTTMPAMQKDSPGNIIVCHFLRPESSQSDADVLAKSNLLPDSSIASDSAVWQSISDGKLIEDGVWPLPKGTYAHPRTAGTFAKFIKTYVRDQKKISLMEAIRKVTLIPAQTLEKSTLQMASKGRLKVGADADIVVFDLDKVEDKATYVDPTQTSTGMSYVIVNGTLVIDNGTLDTKVRPGMPIRRPITA